MHIYVYRYTSIYADIHVDDIGGLFGVRGTQRGRELRLMFWCLISHKVFLKSFCKSQFPHKPVNVFFILVI